MKKLVAKLSIVAAALMSGNGAYGEGVVGDLGACFLDSQEVGRGKMVLKVFGDVGLGHANENVLSVKYGHRYLQASGRFVSAAFTDNRLVASSPDKSLVVTLDNPTVATWISHYADLTIEEAGHDDRILKVECFDEAALPPLEFSYRDIEVSLTLNIEDGDQLPSNSELEKSLLQEAVGQCEGPVQAISAVEVREGERDCNWSGCVTDYLVSQEFSCRSNDPQR